jgi:hypothetical protein
MEQERQVLDLQDPNPELRNLRERWQAELAGKPRPPQTKPGEPAPPASRGIPIERAMQLVAAEKQGR